MNNLKLSLLMFLVGSSLSASNDKDVHQVSNYSSAHAFVHAMAVEARAEDEVAAKAKAKQAGLDKDVEKAEVAYHEAVARDKAKQDAREKEGQLFSLQCEEVSEANRELQRTIKATGRGGYYPKDLSSDSDSDSGFNLNRNYVSREEIDRHNNEVNARAKEKFHNCYATNYN